MRDKQHFEGRAVKEARTVHFDEKLVEGVLAFIVVARLGAGASDGVDLINEDDARRVLPRRGKEVAHTRGTHANEHFNEVRSRDGEERHLSLPQAQVVSIHDLMGTGCASTPTGHRRNKAAPRTPASPAVARASRVLPVPGGPTRSAPLGIFAPSWRYLSGFLRNATNSMISCLASSQPATSLKVVPTCISVWQRPKRKGQWPRWSMAEDDQ